MPALAADPKSNKSAHVIARPLYRKNGPDYGDVQQTHHIWNCPIAAILAALAHTTIGRAFIQKEMIVESRGSAGSVATDFAGVDTEHDFDKKDDWPADNQIKSDRSFQVKLGGKTVEVSDVFYTDDQDRDAQLIYMDSPTKALWPSVVEKAYAAMVGGYSGLDGRNTTVNKFWEVLVGSTPTQMTITAPGHPAADPHDEATDPNAQVTDLKDIVAAAKAASTTPTIGASRWNTKKVTGFHGHVLLGMTGGKIDLYDPMAAKKIALTPEEFRVDFKAILSGNP
jgi:hypothetical protein